MLFDEATSALDNQTEECIKETIHQACENKTGILIAHRLNTLSYCHRIVVMQKGEIEIVGTHEQLLVSDNSYNNMWQAMSKRDSAEIVTNESSKLKPISSKQQSRHAI